MKIDNAYIAYLHSRVCQDSWSRVRDNQFANCSGAEADSVLEAIMHKFRQFSEQELFHAFGEIEAPNEIDGFIRQRKAAQKISVGERFRRGTS